MTSTRYENIAIAARLVSALSAGDDPGLDAVLIEARRSERLLEITLALAVRHVQVCGEYYGTKCQTQLDELAFDANTLARRERNSDV